MLKHWIMAGAAICAGVAIPASAQTYRPGDPPVLEGYPSRILASLERRDSDLKAAAAEASTPTFRFVVGAISRWNPGATVRVAFNGGDPELYAKIEDAATEWTRPGLGNVKLQFKDAGGRYLQWTAQDKEYVADIRISFSDVGYWSMVGTDSIDPKITKPGDPSLNLSGFDKKLPYLWRPTIVHEFGHAFGFQHEHQHPFGTCDFRFDDDADYAPTQDNDGVYIVDPKGHRPGLYTYLGGPPNKWPKTQVDSNLRKIDVSSAYMLGSFDKDSIMKYAFSAFMFISAEQSPCFSKAMAEGLSEGDRQGVKLAYPSAPAAVAVALRERQSAFEELSASRTAVSDIRSHAYRQLDTIGRLLQTTREPVPCFGRAAGGC